MQNKITHNPKELLQFWSCEDFQKQITSVSQKSINCCSEDSIVFFHQFICFPSVWGVLLSIIQKIKRKEKEMRVLMAGLDNLGKMKINQEGTSFICATFGFNIKTIANKKYYP